VASFYTNLLLTTTGGTKKEATGDHKEIAAKWRHLAGVTDVELDDEPVDSNDDVEGLGEWTTSFQIWFEAADDASARALIESLVDGAERPNRSAEIVSVSPYED
jgi:hypothetical protein